jgi:hypothetical protein
MNTTLSTDGGYDASYMRSYLTGDFLKGLKAAAGLTDDMLWAPARNISQGSRSATDISTIAVDTLWLPTEFEMFGTPRGNSVQQEIDAGQARLDYYQTNADRIKYDYGNNPKWYWLASPTSGVAFCSVGTDGTSSTNYSSDNGGVSPAFCIR